MPSSLVEKEVTLSQMNKTRSYIDTMLLMLVSSDDSNPIKFYELNVIDDQPLLKIKSTSLMHGAVMLYEGEV